MNRRGSNATEFALLLPVFVVLLAGGMELSWLFYQQGALRTAVSHGCRTGAMLDPGPLETDITTLTTTATSDVMRRYAAGMGACDSCLATASPVGDPPTRSLQCNMRAPYTGLTGLLGSQISGTLQDSVTIRLEFQRRTVR